VIVDVPGRPGYRVSDDGRLYTQWRIKHGGQGVGKIRYLVEDWEELSQRNVTFPGETRYTPLCVVILTSFKGPRPSDLHECCHRDDDRTNNHIDNLYWGTHADNMSDIAKNGTLKDVNRIMSDDEAKHMAHRYENGATIQQVADDYMIGYGAARKYILQHTSIRKSSNYRHDSLLTDDEIARARELYSTGKYTRQAIANAFNTTHKVIYTVTKDIHWPRTKKEKRVAIF
jgi:hypothetical protein